MKKYICVLIAALMLLCSCSSQGTAAPESASAPEAASESASDSVSSAPEETRPQEVEDWQAYAADFVPANEDEAMATTILRENAGSYLEGECAGEGHILVGSEEKDGLTWLYFRSWYCEFGFEDGVFTLVSGGTGPVAASYKVEDGLWTQQSYAIALTGEPEELAAMFPEDIAKKLEVAPTEEEIAKAIDAEKVYAAAYLAFIGRDAQISTDNLEKTLPDMPVDASNALLSEEKYAAYPTWIGTRESVEGGVRYIYQTEWEGDATNGGTLTFTRRDFVSDEVTDQIVIAIAADGTMTVK